MNLHLLLFLMDTECSFERQSMHLHTKIAIKRKFLSPLSLLSPLSTTPRLGPDIVRACLFLPSKK